MSIQTTIDLIASMLETVTGIGKVNKFERFFTDEEAFRAYHGVTDGNVTFIRSATIALAAIRPAATNGIRDGGSLTASKAQVFTITLMHGQHDASASQIQLAELANAVYDKFDQIETHQAFDNLFYAYGPPDISPIGLAGYGQPTFIVVNQAIVTLTLEEIAG